MKKILTFIGIFLITININAQTESETIQFLNSKLALYTASMGDDPAYFKVKTGEDFGKVILIDIIIGNSLLATIKFHCDQIDGMKTFRAGNGKLCLKIVSSQGLILNKYNGETKETFRTEENIPLETTDEEVLRIKKAFEHLFKLNGFKPVNDELFKK